MCCRYGFIVVPQFSSEVGFVSRLCLEAAKTVEVDGGGGGGGEKNKHLSCVPTQHLIVEKKTINTQEVERFVGLFGHI